MHRYLLVFLAVFNLVACSEYKELGNKMSNAETSYCLNKGFKPGTEAFATCRGEVAVAYYNTEIENLLAGQQTLKSLRSSDEGILSNIPSGYRK